MMITLTSQVCHHYLNTASRTMQSRLRKRGVNGKWCYTHTIRKQVRYTSDDNIAPSLLII